MKTRLGAPGDFAQAYVIAHEVGHHVQALLGITDKVDAMRQRSSHRAIERAVGAAGVAGRLPGRRVGVSRATRAPDPGAGRSSRRRSTRPRRSATTPCSASRKAPWCPRASPTAPARSGGLVQARLERRQPARVQYVRQRAAVVLLTRARRLRSETCPAAGCCGRPASMRVRPQNAIVRSSSRWMISSALRDAGLAHRAQPVEHRAADDRCLARRAPRAFSTSWPLRMPPSMCTSICEPTACDDRRQRLDARLRAVELAATVVADDQRVGA